MKPTTGKVTAKPYRCKECKRVSIESTNHWGDFCPICPKCRKQTVYECIEPCPDTHEKPEPWKMVSLGDVANIKRLRRTPAPKLTTLNSFVRKHRKEIAGNNDDERESMVLNDESLYSWAKSEGVDI